MTLTCPNCDSPNFTRVRTPVDIAGVRFRRHRCDNCRKVFMSAQHVVDMKLASQIEDLIEQPTTTSARMLFVLASSIRGMTKSKPTKASRSTFDPSA